uniref:Phosphate transporter n=1 Tax=Plectus sambesii TaxID=2011161 RepID=A0A914WWG2_9BILA
MIDVVYAPGWMDQLQGVVIAGFIVSFLVAFGMGANDVANAYGTSVGSGVLRLWHAYILSAILNTLGALLLGYQVTQTISKDIFEIDIYDVHSQYNQANNSYSLVASCSRNVYETSTCTRYTSADYIVGELGALTGAAFWLILASVTKMPVSATHSIVGASVGFSLVLREAGGIKWTKLTGIVISWVASPLLAGIFGSIFYLIVKFSVMRRRDPFEAALKIVPVFFWFTLTVNMFTVFYGGSKYLNFDKISWWVALLLSNAIGVIVALFVYFVLGNWIRRRALRIYDKDMANIATNARGWMCSSNSTNEQSKREKNIGTSIELQSEAVADVDDPTKPDGVYQLLITPVKEDRKAIEVFNLLQILSASFLMFSHGSNDTANAIGPLVGIWMTYKTGQASTPSDDRLDLQLLILFGAVGQVIGLIVLGHRVIKTLGKEITEVTAPSGFAVELGAAFTTLIASKLGIPVSTTHCAVGAVVFVGLTRTGTLSGVSWTKFRDIIISWLVTLPVSGAVAALVAYLLGHFLLGSV